MIENVCVFCSSSNTVDPIYFEMAADLGRQLAEQSKTLVYGGGKVGLMGAVAQAVHAHGGQVIGVIPQSLRDLEVCYEQADELIITRDLRDRKAIMEARADAFLVLPGGFGTMEELFDALTLRQLGHHYKPIVFINTANFYDPLFGLLEHMIQGHFARPEHQQLYYNAETPAIALDYLNTYRPLPPIEKFA